MENIIITHKGNPKYLKYVLAQLKATNPSANIILMGDKSNNKYPYIKHVMLSDYSTLANKFANIYIHKNSTDINYELFCYQRWFCVLEYMTKHHLEDVFSLDSDVLVYDNLQNLHNFLKKYDFAVSAKSLTDETISPGYWIAGPPLGYFKQNALKDLCNFFENSYKEEKYLKLFDEKMAYHAKRKEPFGVCDMTQIYFFAKENQNKLFNLSDIFELNNEKVRIDETILDTSDFVEENGHKKLQIKNKTAYCFSKYNNEKIRFPLIHFQGYVPVNAKEWIPYYYIGRKYRLSLFFKKLKNFFTRRIKKWNKRF